MYELLISLFNFLSWKNHDSRNGSFCFRSFNVSRKIVSSAAYQSTKFLHVSWFSLSRNKVKNYVFSIRKIHKALKKCISHMNGHVFLIHENFTKWLTLKETSGSSWSNSHWLQWDHPDQGAQATPSCLQRICKEKTWQLFWAICFSAWSLISTQYAPVYIPTHR